MTLGASKISSAIQAGQADDPFSGVIFVRQGDAQLFAQGYGFANRAAQIPNRVNTRFGIASGCKVFTGVAICQLVEAGKLSFETPLTDCLDIDFPHFDPDITVGQILTHSSGLPDYFDEEIMDDEAYELLWHERPMYLMRSPRDMLPLFQNEPMKFAPGARFSYNNAGFIVLGLIVEQQSGMPFPEYVEQHIFAPAGMDDSGYFALDQLPPRTASGYILDDGGQWRTNIYSIPVIGGPDGGAFTTAPDMAKFWDALLGHQLLSEELTAAMLTPHISTGEDDEALDRYYGYGIWITKKEGQPRSYYAVGGDPGVAFISEYFVDEELLVTILGNTENALWRICGPVIDAALASL
ncbi:MAG: serine hydrolase [Chloroflexi bacterium]|jgi:CubicO group peptidase (beta-lactamase class C family)|nr:serine hydrolase [Chloroflexota bacterium]